jgi:hypothetical protein
MYITVIMLGTLMHPLFRALVTDSSVPGAHLDQGSRMPLAPLGAPENNRYHTMASMLDNRTVVLPTQVGSRHGQKSVLT